MILAFGSSDIVLNAPGIVFAVLAGVLSFLSPCVLPLVPSYIAFITGASTVGVEQDHVVEDVRQRRPMLLGVCFVLGFSAVFISLGATATALGGSLRVNDDLLATIGGILLIALGLLLVGIIRFPMASREARLLHKITSSRRVGYSASFVVGAAFGAGWTPCIGPVLAGILTLAATSGTVWEGVVLLAAYSAGLAIPFLLATFALDRFVVASARFRRWLPWVNRVSGVLLIILGILLVTGTMTRLSTFFARYTPGWIG